VRKRKELVEIGTFGIGQEEAYRDTLRRYGISNCTIIPLFTRDGANIGKQVLIWERRAGALRRLQARIDLAKSITTCDI
jgi:hypothetical protein